MFKIRPANRCSSLPGVPTVSPFTRSQGRPDELPGCLLVREWQSRLDANALPWGFCRASSSPKPLPSVAHETPRPDRHFYEIRFAENLVLSQDAAVKCPSVQDSGVGRMVLEGQASERPGEGRRGEPPWADLQARVRRLQGVLWLRPAWTVLKDRSASISSGAVGIHPGFHKCLEACDRRPPGPSDVLSSEILDLRRGVNFHVSCRQVDRVLITSRQSGKRRRRLALADCESIGSKQR